MRDPITWAFPLGRMFGIDVRVHFTLPVVMVGLVLKVATARFPATFHNCTSLGLVSGQFAFATARVFPSGEKSTGGKKDPLRKAAARRVPTSHSVTVSSPPLPNLPTARVFPSGENATDESWGAP